MQTAHDSPVVLFDGMCNLCVGAVRFILKNERGNNIKFGSLQSDAAKKMLEPFLPIKSNPDSIVLLYNGNVYTEGEAALLMAGFLKWPWSWLRVFRVLPKSIIRFFYRLIARNRYRIFGRRESCMVPLNNEQDRFL